MSSSYWRTNTAIFLGLWLLLLLHGRQGFFYDPGTFWHTVVGEQILSSGRIPHTDPFSCTFAGQPWLASQYWLADVVMALLYRAGELDGVLLATAALLAGLYTWVAHRFLQAGLHGLLVVPLVILIMLASAYHFHPRPHLVTIMLLGWTFAVLVDVESGRIPLSRLGWLVPVFLVWTNMHGGVLGGIATVALTVAGWCLLRLAGSTSPVIRPRQALALGALVGVGALTVLVNPAGWRLPQLWLALLRSPVLPQFINEHKPLQPSDVGDRWVLVLAVVYGVALAGTWPRRPRVTWLIPLVWLVLALRSIRHGPLFSITAAIALADLLPHTRWAAWLARHSSYLFVPPPSEEGAAPARREGWLFVALPLGLFVLSLSAVKLMPSVMPSAGHSLAQLNRTYWPEELLPQLQRYALECQQSQPPREPRVFNEMLFGGYVILKTPQIRVFIDDRCDLYGDEFLKAYFQARGDDVAQPGGDPEQVGRWVEQYQLELALVHPGSAFERYFEGQRDWKQVGKTENAILYRRSALSRGS